MRRLLYVNAKSKAQIYLVKISCTVTAQLLSVFNFRYIISS